MYPTVCPIYFCSIYFPPNYWDTEITLTWLLLFASLLSIIRPWQLIFSYSYRHTRQCMVDFLNLWMMNEYHSDSDIRLLFWMKYWFRGLDRRHSRNKWSKISRPVLTCSVNFWWIMMKQSPFFKFIYMSIKQKSSNWV